MTHFESIDIQKLNIILNHQDVFKAYMNPDKFEGDYAFSFETLRKYADLYDEEITAIPVSYKQQSLNKNFKTRKFVKNGLGLQALPRLIRGTIAKDYYKDIDMVNAHPVILAHLCEVYNDPNSADDLEEDEEVDEIDYRYLSLYNSNRNKTIDEIVKINPELTFDEVKIAILALINGGYSKVKVIKNKTQWLEGFTKEIRKIHITFWNYHTDLHAAVKAKRSDKFYNLEASLMNQLLCNFENLILECMVKKLKALKIIDKNYVMIFDGMMIPRDKLRSEDYTQKILRDIENHIYKKLNIRMTLSVKEFYTFDNIDGFDTTIWTANSLESKHVSDADLSADDEPLFSDEEEDAYAYKSTDNSAHVSQKLTDMQIKRFIKTAQTDGDFADYFVKAYPDMFKVLDNKLYYYNGVYWEETKDTILYNKLDAIYWSLKKVMDSMDDLKGKEAISVFSNIQKLRMTKSSKNIIEAIYKRIELSEDLFDKQEDLLGFTNGTYELRNGTFREGRREDYITTVIPYDFEKVDDKEIEFAKNHFEKVLPDQTIRDLFYTTLASGLRGRVLQKFIIWTGRGANSKGATNKIVRTTFGENLYYKGNNSVLTQEVKGDLSVGIASMHNKRIILYEEPSSNRKIITNMMKELTGGDVMAYRGLYSNNTKTNMRATHIMMCNKKPLLDQIDDAVHRRLIIIPFDAQFRSEEDIKQFIPEGTPNVFIGVDSVEDEEFLNRMKLPFLHILLDYYKVFRSNGYQITNIPERCRTLVKEYMTASDEFTTWFNDTYEFTNDDNDYVKLMDVYQNYKCSELYQNLDKKTRRLKGSKKAIISDIRENPTLKMYFRERYYKNGVDVDNVMIRFKERINYEEE